MEQSAVLSAAEAAEFGEFKRYRRETEISLTLKKLVLDASGRETDKHALKAVCESAKRLGAACVLVSPVNASAARRNLEGSDVPFCCIVGGTGESITAVKKTEAKKAVRQGAGELRLIPCYSALVGGNLSYLKREIKRVKRAAKKCALTVALDDRALSADQVESLAKLPGKQEMLGQLLGTMNAVPTNFVSLFANMVRPLLYALKAIEEKKAA